MRLMGLNMKSYWVAAFLHDFIIMEVVNALVTVVMAIAQVPNGSTLLRFGWESRNTFSPCNFHNYSFPPPPQVSGFTENKVSFFGIFFAILPLSSIPFAYALSFLIDDPCDFLD